jgi:hypothetical protein
MGSRIFLLPGDEIPIHNVLGGAAVNAPLRLGPGLKLSERQTLVASLAGELGQDVKKKLVWIDNTGGRVRRYCRL